MLNPSLLPGASNGGGREKRHSSSGGDATDASCAGRWKIVSSTQRPFSIRGPSLMNSPSPGPPDQTMVEIGALAILRKFCSIATGGWRGRWRMILCEEGGHQGWPSGFLKPPFLGLLSMQPSRSSVSFRGDHQQLTCLKDAVDLSFKL